MFSRTLNSVEQITELLGLFCVFCPLSYFDLLQLISNIIKHYKLATKIAEYLAKLRTTHCQFREHLEDRCLA